MGIQGGVKPPHSKKKARLGVLRLEAEEFTIKERTA
jgi:hypothetical protein